jgi:hypothetical protein
MQFVRGLLALTLVFAITGCGDDTVQTQLDAQTGGDGHVYNDAGPDMYIPQDDTGPDMVPTEPALLTTVVDKLTAPTSATEFAVDLDGNGTKDNQLGAIMGVVASFYAVQPEIDNQINSGALIMLMEVFAQALTDDQQTRLQYHMGNDNDGDPTDNFSGSEEFGLSSTSPTNLILQGGITSGAMKVGPGDLQISLPLMPGSLVVVDLKKSQVTADVSASGMANGQINGAIPESDVDQKIIPMMAQMLTNLLADPNIDPGMKIILDPNSDGTVTADEIKKNVLISAFLASDVDTDGDKTLDALSAGMGFTAVPCKIAGKP